MFKFFLYSLIALILSPIYAVDLEGHFKLPEYNDFVRIGYANFYPTLNDQDEATTQIVNDVCKAFRKAHIYVVLSHYDEEWGHVINDLQSRKLDASIWWYKTPQREKLYLFSDKPIIEVSSVIVGLQSNQKIKKLSTSTIPSNEDLKPYSIGYIDGFFTPSVTDDMKKVPVKNESELFEKFISGEFDFIYTPKGSTARYINDDELYTVYINKSQGYIIFSNQKDPKRASMLKSIFDYNFKPSK